jgi:aminomethyltransferase
MTSPAIPPISGTEPSPAAKTTPLDALHRALGGRMVEFAGYALAVQYPTGILVEHRHTRSHAGLFDVSHMGQLRVALSAAAALEELLPMNCVDQQPFRQRYTFRTNADGGVEDDLMVLRMPDHFHMIVNAARKAADTAAITAHLPPGTVTPLPARALLALQGPAAGAVLARLVPALAAAVQALPFMMAAEIPIHGVPCLVIRSGYAGEDGFEISLPATGAVTVAEALLAEPEVAPIGLGARDSLRLEAGLCLYGHDLTSEISPVEAGLTWAIPSHRQAGGARAGGFPGAARILAEIAAGPKRQRVGLLPEGRSPVRDGAALLTPAGEEVGRVTSGGFSPTLDRPIAMGYVGTPYAAPGASLVAMVRGKPVAVAVTQLPFVPHCYRRGG